MDKKLTKKQLAAIAGAALLLIVAALCVYVFADGAPKTAAEQATFEVIAGEDLAADASAEASAAQDGATEEGAGEGSAAQAEAAAGASGAEAAEAAEAAGDAGGASGAAATAQQPAQSGAAAAGTSAGATDAAAISGSAGGGGDAPSSSQGQNGSSSGSSTSASEGAAQAETIQVYVEIDSSRAASYGFGTSMGAKAVTVAKGASVYDALCAMGVSVGGSSSYVSSIGGLAEKQCGSGSGWLYSVNGVMPNKSCGKYTLTGDESIKWTYTLNLGQDL